MPSEYKNAIVNDARNCIGLILLERYAAQAMIAAKFNSIARGHRSPKATQEHHMGEDIKFKRLCGNEALVVAQSVDELTAAAPRRPFQCRNLRRFATAFSVDRTI